MTVIESWERFGCSDYGYLTISSRTDYFDGKICQIPYPFLSTEGRVEISIFLHESGEETYYDDSHLYHGLDPRFLTPT